MFTPEAKALMKRVQKIIIIISPTTSKLRRNMGWPLQGRGAIAVQLSLPLSVMYISIAMLESLKRHLEGVS